MQPKSQKAQFLAKLVFEPKTVVFDKNSGFSAKTAVFGSKTMVFGKTAVFSKKRIFQ